MTCSSSRKVIFIEWEREFIDFIKGITLSPSLRGNLVVHIFYPQDVSRSILPKYRPWLFKHPAPTANDRKYAAWKMLEDYVLKYKYPYSDSSTISRTSIGRDKIPSRVTEGKEGQFGGFLLSKSLERIQELVEAVASKYGVTLKAINCETSISTLLDLVEYSCSICKMGFMDNKELTKHDTDFHNLLCYNPGCTHSHKLASFSSEKELQQHVSSQLRCTFCPGKVFCSKENLEDHLRQSHKKCSCPCGEYFGNRKTYLDHFFSFYPSPKEIAFRIPIQEPNSNKKKNNANLTSKSQYHQERKSCCSNHVVQRQTSLGYDSFSRMSNASSISIPSDENPSINN